MTTYRAFPIDETGRVFGPPREFEVQTDIEAIAQAARFGDSCALESLELCSTGRQGRAGFADQALN